MTKEMTKRTADKIGRGIKEEQIKRFSEFVKRSMADGMHDMYDSGADFLTISLKLFISLEKEGRNG